ncbi:MAG TPA: sigma-70 family RNA polymerase sigma factor [bacterium]|nr:sigma-70 family RNA polymerase sigma factor [bacterium]
MRRANETSEQFDEYEITLIRIKSKSVVGKAGFLPDDMEDIMQDIIVDLLERLPKYNPDKSSRHTFIDDLANNKIARMLCDKSAAKRHYSLAPATLDMVDGKVHGDDAEPVSEKNEICSDTSRTLSDFEIIELRQDIVRALKKLPPKLRDICVMLMQKNICAVAAETGIPKATLIDHIKKIRNYFEISGLEKYF